MNLKNSSEIELRAHLYDDPSVENLNLDELASYLKEKAPVSEVDLRGSILENFEGSVEDLAERFAKARVRNPEIRKADFDPLYGEIRFEEDLIRSPGSEVTGVLYDGASLDKIYRDLLPEDETDFSYLHIVFTNRLFGTWDGADNRYHARVSVYGFPSLISTTGIVEAPAKPKEFYRKKRQRMRLGQKAGFLEGLKEEFEGEFIDYDDERLTEVMKGYVMQAVFYHLTREPFCDKKYCRLYNSHWQGEVLEAQLEPPEFCEEHEGIISDWNGS